MNVDPMIIEIYYAYSHQDEYSTIGLPEKLKLLSALENMARLYKDSDLVIRQYYLSVIDSINFVRKHSTSNLD